MSIMGKKMRNFKRVKETLIIKNQIEIIEQKNQNLWHPIHFSVLSNAFVPKRIVFT